MTDNPFASLPARDLEDISAAIHGAFPDIPLVVPRPRICGACGLEIAGGNALPRRDGPPRCRACDRGYGRRRRRR